jgi:hypothetical protein
MNPDYSKTKFTNDEIILMNKQSEIIRHKYPDKIPILIRIKSNVLTTEKYKFLIPNNLTLPETISGISTRLNNKENKSLLFYISNLEGNDQVTITNEINGMELEDIYTKYKDPSINALILSVSRSTLYKWGKSFIF